ncbi:MAG: hypothetical protein GEU79_13655 [Acidimicrobiia bacterium]|nr:hypothetical protein [Acidimicrobiia bacterium]
MEIRETSLLFPETEGEGPVTASTTLSFPRRVRRVAAGIAGYTARFEDNEDHHLGRLEVEVSGRVDDDDDTIVNVRGVFGLRDWSNEWDDPYSGVIDVAVLAELSPVSTPQPGDARGDLIIVDAESSQVIQHFRSSDHLAPPNVFPDNSIRLIASKPTIVRLYPDYDASSGLPVIASLNGELVVEGNGTVTTLSAAEVITPRRDVATDRGNRGHTLNFVIPENLCLGTLTLRGKIFDQSDPTQFSEEFTRTITFDTQPALRIMAVGIEYTGDDIVDDATDTDLAAPSEADFVDVFDFTDTLYPIPDVEITTYQTMEYDGATISDISNGCDELGDMRDAVGDLRGDSDDIVYGLFNVGVDTGSVGGCGGGGVGVGRIGNGGTAAHEVGHALGRKHAPCDNVTRCAQPLNTDGGYPDYSGYDSDSIGEYGVDPRTWYARVIDPANGHDFMGYSGGDWVSPYTYKALMGAIPIPDAGGAAFSTARASVPRRRDNEWIRVKQPKLFLRLDIDRTGNVVVHPSFHFPAHPRPLPSTPTDYTIEFVDEEQRVLSSTCLNTDDDCCCGCGCGEGATCRSVRIRQAVAFPTDAKEMRLLRCDELVDSWPIPDPPHVEVEVDCNGKYEEYHKENQVTIRWTVSDYDSTDPEATSDDRGPWALVQWRDRSGTWRGCAPRTRENEVTVARSSLGTEKEIHVRVLVTTGIATGVGEWSGPCGELAEPSSPGAPQVDIVAVPRGENRAELTTNPRAVVVGPRIGKRGNIRWHGSDGGELGRGRTLDLSRLPVGQTVVTASVVGAEDQVAPSHWLLERTGHNRFFVLSGDQHPDDPCAPPDDPDDGGHDHPNNGDSEEEDSDNEYEKG